MGRNLKLIGEETLLWKNVNILLWDLTWGTHKFCQIHVRKILQDISINPYNNG